MKRFHFFVLLSLLLIPTLTQAQSLPSANNLSWDPILKDYLQYSQEPSPTLAKKIQAAFTEMKGSHLNNEQAILIDSHLKTLFKQIQKGDESAFRLTYALLPFSDGAYTENLEDALNQYILPQPKKFLQFLIEINPHEIKPQFIHDWTFVSGKGSHLQALEKVKKNILAIRGVHDSDLKEIKSAVLTALEKEIKSEVEGAAREGEINSKQKEALLQKLIQEKFLQSL